MDTALIAILRRFFTAPSQLKLRRDLARDLATALGVTAHEADEVIAGLMSDRVLAGTQVHFYDAEAEDVVQRDGLRLIGRLERDRDGSSSGMWRAVVGHA